MKIKTALRFRLTPIEWQLSRIKAATDVGKDVGKKVYSCFAGGVTNWCSHSGNQYGDSLENLVWNDHLTQLSHSLVYIQRHEHQHKTLMQPH